METSDVPPLRVRRVHDASLHQDGDFVLYWMIAFRRSSWNFSLQRAAEWAAHLGKPLVILEALRCRYPWASDRLHRFILQGMADNQDRFARKRVTYYPYLEKRAGDGKGLLRSFAQRACVVVTDDYPCFFLPRMVEAAAAQVGAPLELVDSNGLLPLRSATKVFARAVDFRRFLQKSLLPHLAEMPREDPLARRKLPRLEEVPETIRGRWPPANVTELAKSTTALAKLPIDHNVPDAPLSGGSGAARHRLRRFLSTKLSDYGELRNQPEHDATSGLSPYLHFGHLSVHEVFAETTKQEDWSPNCVAEKASGSSRGWWGASEQVEAFLDELITWRELGYNMTWQRDDYDQYESLPQWAQKTLAQHARDPRRHVYSLAEFEAAQTHDPLWNASQRQLLGEGKIHNYLRMLWGKKILEWSATPQDALETMLQLNNKYALDGRDPNSYSGIFWVLGRYDRAWGPERPIFGKIRYMSSENTARKCRVRNYIAKWEP